VLAARYSDLHVTADYGAHVVSLIADGSAVDRRGKPFKRRNYWPGAALGLVLFIATAMIWGYTLNRPADVREAAVCNPPPEPTDASQLVLGDQVSSKAMAEVVPARLADTKIRVLNASGQGGQAADISTALRDLGFAQPTAANDPIYADTRLTCQGQIRLGPSGKAAAAALWLVAPCVELFEDTRPDDTVDLALGTDFSDLARNDDINAVLASLRPEATTAPDMALVTKAHATVC